MPVTDDCMNTSTCQCIPRVGPAFLTVATCCRPLLPTSQPFASISWEYYVACKSCSTFFLLYIAVGWAAWDCILKSRIHASRTQESNIWLIWIGANCFCLTGPMQNDKNSLPKGSAPSLYSTPYYSILSWKFLECNCSQVGRINIKKSSWFERWIHIKWTNVCLNW